MSKRIVITGIGGYVGSEVGRQLVTDGYKVTGFGHDENFSLLKKAFGTIKLVAGDVADEEKLKEVFYDADAIIHTASPTTEKFCIECPWEAVKAIIYGTRAVVKTVKDLHTPLLIHFSTQAVYMNFHARPLPLSEDMEPKPDTVYGALKYAAERELANSPSLILRPANIYGENSLGIKRENVITRFVSAAKKGDSLVIKGDGLQRADYVHLRDVVFAVEKLLEKAPVESSMPKIYNIGSGVSRSVKDVAEYIMLQAAKNGFPTSSITYTDADTRIAADRVLSIKRLEAILPSFPNATFEEYSNDLFSV